MQPKFFFPNKIDMKSHQPSPSSILNPPIFPSPFSPPPSTPSYSSSFNSNPIIIFMRISKQPENTGGIVCHYNRDYFLIEQRYQAKYQQHQTEYLQVNRRTQELTSTKDLLESAESRKFSALLGVIDFDGEKFLLFCDEAKVVSAIDKLEVFEVSSLFFLGYTDDRVLKNRPERKEIYRKIREYYIILKSGFYFSYKYNLTLPLRLQAQQTLAERFVWNNRLFADFEKYRVSFRWRCPLIQGFVKSFEVFLEGSKLGYVLISRRSNRKGGTRYFDRGMDEDGYVANFCETEQVIRLEEYVVSDLQIRGSVPLFFEQVGLTTRTKLNRGYELTHQVYKRHMQRLIRHYRRVFFANLLSVGKKGERMLTEQLQAHIKAEVNPSLKYLYYDFHHKVAGGYYEKVDEIIAQLRTMKLNTRYYVCNTKTGAVLEEPAGVFRTNCLDCLDRTNFFQAKLALITLEAILKQFGVCNRDLLAEMRDNNADNDFIRNFRHIWADNGDAISFHYTGTGSTHTDITRDGKRGWLGNFKHKYKTITRFYNQNFWDFYKMRLVGLLLGEAPRDKMSVSKLMKQRENEYLIRETHQIYIFTWKAPKKPPKSLFLFPNKPKIIVIGIQDLSQEEKWIRLINDSIDKERYISVQEKKAYGNLVKIFAARELRNDISLVQHGRLKFNSYYNAVLSNKCANFIRFSLNNTRFVFVGCQLQKGQEFLENRIRNLRDLHEHAFQVEEVGLQRSASILADDVIFLFGNMNTTVPPVFKPEFARFNDLAHFGEEQRRLVGKMMEGDEFQQIRESLLEYRQYEEEEVTFPPTYRFSGGSFDLDCSGWPDRIWYSSENKINCTRYGVIEELRGEHVPVIGTFLVEVEKVNNQKKERICNQIMDTQAQSLGIQDLNQEEEVEEVAVKL